MGSSYVQICKARSLSFLPFLATTLASELTYLDYIKKFNKSYEIKEFTERESIYYANLRNIVQHNEKYVNGDVSYLMGINQFTDMTHEEFQNYIQGLPPTPPHLLKTDPFSESVLQSLKEKYENYDFKESLDWRDEGIVTSVKDQGQCGSCSAFAATGAVESCFIKNNGEMIDDLSEQYLVDCANGYEHDGFTAEGCQGAMPVAYFAYLADKHNGHDLNEECYPYEAEDLKCRYEKSCEYTKGVVTDQVYSHGTNEEELKTMVVEYGPVVTGLDATALQFYDSGILDENSCCDAADNFDCVNGNNHAVLVVGYGSENGKDFWIVKNSWSTFFGENGFFRIKKGTGHCGFGWQLNNVGLCA